MLYNYRFIYKSYPVFQVIGKRIAFRRYKKMMLRSALPGTGIIAGGALRAVLEAAGVRNVLTKVGRIEYDPNRSARIALLHYIDGEKRYIIAPRGLKVGENSRNFEEVCPFCGRPVYAIQGRYGIGEMMKMTEANKAFAHFRW